MTQDPPDHRGDETRLHAALLAYVEARQAGQDPDRGRLLAANPQIRHELEEFFAADSEMERLAAPLRIAESFNPQSAIRNPPSDLGRLGDFRLLREIGRGGMGVVYEAEQVSLRRRVALKVLPFAAALDPRQLQRFKNEALAAAHLRHEHIVPVHAAHLRHEHLLLDPHGQLWVTDFGLAQVAGDAGLTATGELLGTLRYASPEQVLARRGVVDHRSDLYSLGATLYELLTLRPLFEGRDRNELLRQIADEEPRPPRSLHPSVPPELETVVLKALRKEPAERYPTARDLADDLQRFADNRPVLARRPTPAERLWKFARRHPSLVGGAAVVLLLLLAGSLVSTLLIRGEQGRTRAEQRRAEAAYRLERQRAAVAEARFHLARRSVDELFRISEEELADRPGLEGLRKRLLGSVLAYYQEFLEQRQGNAEAQADLREAKQRAEKILADLAVLRAASQLHLLCQPPVLDDLGLDDAQRPKVREFCARVGKEWRDSLNDVGRVSAAQRRRRAVERARAYEAEVNVLLTPAQRVRLRQIGLQAEGPGAFAEPEVVAELQLTADQRDRIRTIEEDALFGWMRRPPTGDSAKDPEARPGSANERILAVLTEEQVRRWRALTGRVISAAIMPFPAPAAPFGPKGPRPPLRYDTVPRSSNGNGVREEAANRAAPQVPVDASGDVSSAPKAST
jgi:hypothetical protein